MYVHIHICAGKGLTFAIAFTLTAEIYLKVAYKTQRESQVPYFYPAHL